FTDFKGFTSVAAHMDPDQLMEELNDCFSAFDEIIARHNLYKIKTIGDAYMCAGGIPESNETNPQDTVKAALEMQEFMQRRRKEKLLEGKDYWQCRLGINTGPVRAGVIGRTRFAYDIWGNPVNIASRMESGGEPNKVNISEDTYELVKDQFDCEFRGQIEVKNGLKLKMYFVNGVKP
ncbi:MAG: adenylate/guanylate cyclase domain-containing protein, partial [Bacteroidota bacterium]